MEIVPQGIAATRAATKKVPASFRARGRAIVVAIAWMLSSIASNSADSAAPKRVLIMHSFARDAATFGSIAATFRAELRKRITAPVIFDEIDLEADRTGADEGAPVIAFLNARFANQPPDVIVAVGARRSAARHRRCHPSGHH
jgi:hypothetical protein